MSDPPTPRPRRGWREPIEAGLYRPHRRACPASLDRQPRRRCACPYELQVPDGRGGSRTVTVTGLTLRQARAERGRLVASPPAPPIGAGTLTDFTVAYFRAKAPVLAAATIRNRDEDYRLRIAPTLGALALTALTREVVEGWFAELVATHPGRRRAVQQSLATLRVLLATAEAWGRIPGPNPAARLRLPPPDPDERPAVRRVLTAAQVRALYAACGSPRVETLARVAVEGGLRRGELIGLRWPDLDLPARRLTVARQVTQEQAPDGPVRVVGPTKGRRARLVALSPPTVAALAAWYAQAVVEGGADASGFVWPGREGQAMHNRSPGRAIERAQVRAGLVDEQGRPLVGLHGCRHTCASLSLSAGVPLPVVAAQLGHSSPTTTARVYAHLVSLDDLDRVAAVFADPPARATAEGDGLMVDVMGEGEAPSDRAP